MLRIKRTSQLVARDVPYIMHPKQAIQTLRQRYGVSDHRDLASSHLFEQFKTSSIEFPYVRANDIEDGRVNILLSTAQYYAVDSKGTVRSFLPSVLEFKVRHLLGQPRKENVHQEQAYFAEVKALLEDQYPMPLETAKVVEKPKLQLASANQIMQLARKDLDTGMCQIPEAEEEYWVNAAKGAASMTASQMKEYQQKQIDEYNKRSLDAVRFSAFGSVTYLGATVAGVTDPSRLAGAAETGMSVGALAAPRSTGAVLNSAIYNASGHPKAPLNSSNATTTSSLSRYEKFDGILNIPSKGGDTKRDLSIIPNETPPLFSNKYPEHEIDTPKIVPNERLQNVSGQFNYVVKEDGSLVVGKTGHTSLTGGAPVQAAGEIKIVNGDVKSIDNASGHFQPAGGTIESITQNAFKDIGIDTSGKFTHKEWVFDPSLPRGGKWTPVKK